MIEPDKRKAIYCLCNEGISIREISRRLKVSRNTVRVIKKQKGNVPDTPRADRVDIDSELLRSLYNKCNGWVERVYDTRNFARGERDRYRLFHIDPIASRAWVGNPRKTTLHAVCRSTRRGDAARYLPLQFKNR